MKQKEHQDNYFGSFGVSEYNREHEGASLPFEKVFQARYGSQAACYTGNVDPEESLPIYFHGGIGTLAFDRIERYDPISKKFTHPTDADRLKIKRRMTFEQELDQRKLINNRVDHTILFWRQYPTACCTPDDFPAYRDKIIIYGGQTYASSGEGALNCAEGCLATGTAGGIEKLNLDQLSSRSPDSPTSGVPRRGAIGRSEERHQGAKIDKATYDNTTRTQRLHSIKAIRNCIEDICVYDIGSRAWSLLEIN